MRSRPVLLVVVVSVMLAGCMPRGDTAPIPPLPSSEGRAHPGLGPEAKPLSSGPGYKGSPRWSPGGDRVAFVVDGYVVDRAVEGGPLTRWTTRDFSATRVEWVASDVLVVVGGAEEDGLPAAYRTDSGGDGSLAMRKVAQNVLAIGPGPEDEDVVVALRAGLEGSAIMSLTAGRMGRLYTDVVRGTVTGVSTSPRGDRLVLAVRPPGGSLASMLYVFDLDGGGIEEIPGPGEGQAILGAPQWTDHGIYFVAGEVSLAGGDEPRYDLYRTTPDGPEPAPGVGKDFVAGGARVSPDGDRLAVVGRFNPNSPLNLYVLDLEEGSLDAVTTNEDMEIKTGPDDLAWSPSGASVAIVARGASTGEPEVRAAPADQLLDTFYNLYEIPVTTGAQPGRTP